MIARLPRRVTHILEETKQVDLAAEDRDAFLHAASLYSSGVTDSDVEGDSVLEEMIGEWRQGLWQASGDE